MKYIIKILKKEMCSYIIGFILVIAGSFLNFLLPYFFSKVFDGVISKKMMKEIILLLLVYFIIKIVADIFKNISMYVLSIAGKNSVKRIRIIIFNNLFLSNSEKHNRFKTGDLINRTLNEVEYIESFTSTILFQLFSDLVISIIVLSILLYRYPYVGILILVVIPISCCLQIKNSKIIGKYTEIERNKFTLLSSIVGEILGNLFGIISINADEYMLRRYSNNQDAEIKAYLNMLKKNINNKITQTFILVSFNAVALIIGTKMVLTNQLSLGGLISLNMYILMVTQPFLRLAQNYIKLEKLKIYISRLNEVIDTYNDKFKMNGIEIDSIDNIKVDKLNFSYTENKLLFSDISVLFSKKECIRIDGDNGVGKTSLLKIIFGYISIDNNSVYINNNDISKLNIKNYRNKIVYISQDVFLFNGTIIENIILDSKINVETVRGILKKVCANEWIYNLPNGIYTEIKEGAANLSGGEKQKIALARLYCKNFDVLILDEAFIGLDKKSKSKIIDNILNEFSDKIILIISHDKYVQDRLNNKCKVLNI